MAGKPAPLVDQVYIPGGQPIVRHGGEIKRIIQQRRHDLPIQHPGQTNSVQQAIAPPIVVPVEPRLIGGIAEGTVAIPLGSPVRGPFAGGPAPVPSVGDIISARSMPGVTSSAPNAGIRRIADSHSNSGIIPANGTITINVPGISFYFEVLIGAGTTGVLARVYKAGQPSSLLLFFQGTGIRYGNIIFDTVEVQNTTANQVNYQIVVGGGIPNWSYDEFLDNRTVSNQAAAGGVAIANAPTKLVSFTTRVGAWTNSLAGGASQIVTESAAVGSARKTITFSNNDAALSLQVLDLAGNIAGTVQPATSWAQDMGGTLSLKNPNGGAVACNISEIYYL